MIDAGKINEIDQSLQSVIIAYQHNAENRAVLDLASHDARRVLNRDSYHQMNCLSMHGQEVFSIPVSKLFIWKQDISIDNNYRVAQKKHTPLA